MFKTSNDVILLDSQALNRDLRKRADRETLSTETWHTDATLAWLRDNKVSSPSAMSDAMRASCEALSQHLYAGKPSDTDPIFRLASVRVKANQLVVGPTRWTAYNAPRYRFGEPEHEVNNDINVWRECLILTKAFLSETGYDAALRATAPHWERTHRAFVHFDFYPARKYTETGFHKDTWGYTLFVGLLYLNEESIQGPDIIKNPHKLTRLYDFKDPKPKPPLGFPHTLRMPRPDPFLPACFLDPIKLLIEENEKSKMVIERTGIVPRFGMISFIDELVHHATPVSVPSLPHAVPCGVDDGTYYKLSGGALQDNRQSIAPADKAHRTFIRVWVTLVPDDKVFPEKTRPSSSNDTRLRQEYRIKR